MSRRAPLDAKIWREITDLANTVRRDCTIEFAAEPMADGYSLATRVADRTRKDGNPDDYAYLSRRLREIIWFVDWCKKNNDKKFCGEISIDPDLAVVSLYWRNPDYEPSRTCEQAGRLPVQAGRR